MSLKEFFQTDRWINAGCHITPALGGGINEPNEDGFHVKSCKTLNSSGFCFVLTGWQLNGFQQLLLVKWELAIYEGKKDGLFCCDIFMKMHLKCIRSFVYKTSDSIRKMTTSRLILKSTVIKKPGAEFLSAQEKFFVNGLPTFMARFSGICTV